LTKFLTVTVKKSLKDETEKKLKAQTIAKELNNLKDDKTEVLVIDVKL
jgi:hypothetical protein